MDNNDNNLSSNRPDYVAQIILLASLFLIPLIFVPSSLMPFQLGKAFLIYAAIVATTAAWVMGRLKDGKLGLSKTYFLGMFLVIPAIFGIATLFSGSKVISLLGHGFEIGTLSFIIAMFLMAYLVSELFTTTKSHFYAYVAFLSGAVLVAFIQLLRLLIGPGFLSFGVLTSAASSLIGSWYDLGIYIGSVALFSLISLEFLKLSRGIRTTFIALLVASLFILSVVNFNLAWYVLGIFALIFFVYRFTVSSYGSESGGQRTIPIISLVVLIICVVFIFSKGNIYSTLGAEPFNIPLFNRLAVENVEVRPSLQGTTQVFLQTLKDRQIFGTGPNRFANAWQVAKPAEVNSSLFWGIDFNYGIGLIPTFFITTGILGMLAWALFFVLFVRLGFKALFVRQGDFFKEYLSVSSFIVALYFWIFTIIYVPSASLLLLTFFFTGLFLASIGTFGIAERMEINFLRDPKLSFTSVLVFVGLLLVILFAGYTVGRRFVSVYYFNGALTAANNRGNIDSAELQLVRAIQFTRDDEYFRTLTDLYLARINILVSQQNQLSADTLQSQFRTYIGSALSAAQAARDFDRTNYANWITLGRVYEVLVPLNTEGAYTNANEAYNQALKLNPKNPALVLMQARLEAAKGDLAKARQYVDNALSLKRDYTEAIYFLAQLQVNQGDVDSAIKSVEAATLVSPNDPGVFFQLGLLRYTDKDYAGAVSAMERAVSLVPAYANAKYFLGLSLNELGKSNEAIAIFESIKETNPENAEVDLILSNLRAGRDPFSGARPPIDDKPEQRQKPPIDEDSTATTTKTTTDR